MNSLNLLSSRVIGPSTSPTRPRSRSQDHTLRSSLTEELLRGRSQSEQRIQTLSGYQAGTEPGTSDEPTSDEVESGSIVADDEKRPLLNEHTQNIASGHQTGLRYLIKRLADALTAILSTIGMPVVYVARCFQDESGRYSPLVLFRRKRKRQTKHTKETSSSSLGSTAGDHVWSAKSHQRSSSSGSLSSSNSESDGDLKRPRKNSRHTGAGAEPSQGRRQSARIKLMHNDDIQRRRQNPSIPDESTHNTAPLTVDSLKSPTAPGSASLLRATRYPHAPHPPRPLVPRRQPSYSNLIAQLPSRVTASQKTLVLDLDETLIHSLAKGGRMSTGHMVEVKLNVPVALSPTQAGQNPPAVIGPQHPILYYVHKRPHCDEFLRKVSKWFKLVVFTASVQEYADPVIDWLETERKYFQGRYYRQHCTFRNGSYIKDLSSIEPDLSKVIILDNSPVSYIFHEDNAIPIEGWINDPTDNDLVHLIPMLEALQYVTDVRALLALRRGEAEAA